MNAMKNKIKSPKGASITFALLLFLVCAIISSIVIVAATAVGGRASKMAELDQRYYAVNSAAELLRNVLEEETVTATTGTKIVSTVDQTGTTVTEGETENMDTEIYVDNGAVDIDISADTTSLVATAAKNVIGVTTKLEPLSLSATGSGITDATALDVVMVPSFAGKELTVNVANVDSAKKGTYTLKLIFKADIVQNNNERTTYGTPEPVRKEGKVVEGEYTRKKTVEAKTVSTIRWKLIDMKVSTDAIGTVEEGGGD